MVLFSSARLDLSFDDKFSLRLTGCRYMRARRFQCSRSVRRFRKELHPRKQKRYEYRVVAAQGKDDVTLSPPGEGSQSYSVVVSKNPVPSALIRRNFPPRSLLTDWDPHCSSSYILLEREPAKLNNATVSVYLFVSSEDLRTNVGA